MTQQLRAINRRSAIRAGIGIGAATAFGAIFGAPAKAASDSRPPTGLWAPPQAINAGYQSLAFQDGFDNIGTIDMSGTGTKGYRWYTDQPAFNTQGQSPGVTVSGSYLTLKPALSESNWQLSTVSPKTGNGFGMRYGYIETRMRFDPMLGTSSPGWPSFWSLAVDHYSPLQGGHWAELDFFEAWHPSGGAFAGQFVGTMHDWQDQPTRAAYHTYNNNCWNVGTIDWASFHTYGTLWQPGRVSWYFDNMQVGTQSYSTSGLPVPLGAADLGAVVPGAYSVLDTAAAGRGMGIILGTGANWPLQVDWVSVWR